MQEFVFPWSMPSALREIITSWPDATKSPYSNSYYSSSEKSWDYTPVGCLRASDHWTFRSRKSPDPKKVHCPLDRKITDGSWVLARWNGTKYITQRVYDPVDPMVVTRDEVSQLRPGQQKRWLKLHQDIP